MGKAFGINLTSTKAEFDILELKEELVDLEMIENRIKVLAVKQINEEYMVEFGKILK